MGAATWPIKIEVGATFTLNAIWKDSLGVPVNLTGYTARMQVKKTKKDLVAVLTFTTENGAIVLGGALGTVAVTGDATSTTTVVIKAGVYDLELVSPTGVVKRLLEGEVEISFEVTT